MSFNYVKYRQYLNSYEWRYKKAILEDLKNYKCHNCGITKNIQIHHLTYKHLYYELEYLEDTILLCEECHKFEHAELNDIKRVNELKNIKKQLTFKLMDY